VEIVLASNFDDELVRQTADLPVSTFFGSYPTLLTGGGRPPRILPPVSDERFRDHVRAVHAAGRRFYATLNTSDLGLREYEPGYLDRFHRDLAHLLDLGVDGLVVALPALIEAIRDEHPEVPISVSAVARIRSVTQGEHFLKLGADTIVLEEANRDFSLIRGLVRRGARVEVLVNETCLPACPYRAHHLNTSSLASMTGAPCPSFEYPMLECGLEYVRDPSKLLSGIFVRPEDLEVFEEAGVSRFKVSGRHRTTEWLARAARAYAERALSGDLTQILSLAQVKGPKAALHQLANEPSAEVRALAEAFAGLGKISIDNGAFPKGFLRRIAATDCDHRSCAECGYCPSVAERVLRINGEPPSRYQAPRDMPVAVRLLDKLGTAPPAVDGDAAPTSPNGDVATSPADP